VHNVDKAGDTMIDQLCIFRYTVGISDDYIFQAFILPQAVASLTMPVNFSLADMSLLSLAANSQGNISLKGAGVLKWTRLFYPAFPCSD